MTRILISCLKLKTNETTLSFGLLFHQMLLPPPPAVEKVFCFFCVFLPHAINSSTYSVTLGRGRIWRNMLIIHQETSFSLNILCV